MESDKGREAVQWLASAKWLLRNGTVDGGRLYLPENGTQYSGPIKTDQRPVIGFKSAARRSYCFGHKNINSIVCKYRTPPVGQPPPQLMTAEEGRAVAGFC